MECAICGDGIDYKRTKCAECWTAKINAGRERVKILEEECKLVCATIQSYVERLRPALHESTEIGLREARIKLLQDRIAAAKQTLETDKQKVAKMRAHIGMRRDALHEANIQLAIKTEQLSHYSKSTTGTVENLQRLCEIKASELAHRRRALITELLTLFPINPSPNSDEHSLIINIILPNNGIYSSFPPETLSAALGNVAHVVYLLSSYLGVVLPCPIDFAGSRSSIRTNEEPSRRFPLYGTRVGDMEVGTRLLNYDIVQLCYSQGVSISRSAYAHTLPNLLALLRSPTLGWPGPHELTSARLRRPLPLLRVNSQDGSVNNININGEEGGVVYNNNDVDDDDFIVLENTVIPTPSQSEDLAQFERALFIDNS
jgi:hypothetical protein